MRFDSKKNYNPIIVRKWFAFFPVEINQETKWLEFVKVRGYYWRGASGKRWWNNIELTN